jgi:hypothetical protein
VAESRDEFLEASFEKLRIEGPAFPANSRFVPTSPDAERAPNIPAASLTRSPSHAEARRELDFILNDGGLDSVVGRALGTAARWLVHPVRSWKEMRRD